jgi:hypothetical protein
VRYQLCISETASADLEALWEQDPAAGALIEAIFDELEVDQTLLDALTAHGFVNRDDPQFDVQKWVAMWRRGINLWRLKPFDIDGRSVPYRVIYAYVPAKRRYVVLGIVPREFDTYEPQNERAQRILAEYSEL